MSTSEDRSAGISEAEIAVHWQEEEYFHPSPEFIAQANLTDRHVYDRMSIDNFPECFKEFADTLTWDKYWEKTFDGSNAPFWRWFVGGRLNASVNCIDRHLDDKRNKTAIHFVPELEEDPIQHITYHELWVRVNEFAALLRDYAGIKKGDVVTIHMPMVPELPISMLACARIGAIHSVVFGGFSAKACADRMVDAGSSVLITMDGYYRGGKYLNHKEKADQAVAEAKSQSWNIEKVLVWERRPGTYSSPDSPIVEGRDHIVNDVIKAYYHKKVDPVSVEATDPLFIMYSSGSTGRPKAAVHGTGGYLSWVTWQCKNIQDIHANDVYWCMADIGWITGHSYIVYGPLANGASTVIYEGVPVYPDAGRPWRIAEELGVNIFHTSPTAIRQLRKDGPNEPSKYNYQFKVMVTVGEPIEPEVWRWYYHSVGKDKAVILDTWWQTENGGWLCAHIPALMPMKPGSAGPGLPGVHPFIVDDEGNEIPPGSSRAGNLCIRAPWPGIFLGLWKDPERYKAVYYEKANKKPDSKDWRDWPYWAGDGATRAADGYIRILGRLDDVINVAGHRLGTKELESAALKVPGVAEAAVIPVADEVKGRVPEIYVALQPGVSASEELRKAVSDSIAKEISPIARPSKVWLVPDLPKTRSGKIMRRVLASISNRRDLGDVATLANPDIVEHIRQMVQG